MIAEILLKIVGSLFLLLLSTILIFAILIVIRQIMKMISYIKKRDYSDHFWD